MGGGGGTGGGGGGGTGIFVFTVYALDAAVCGKDNTITLSNGKHEIKTPACKICLGFTGPRGGLLRGCVSQNDPTSQQTPRRCVGNHVITHQQTADTNSDDVILSKQFPLTLLNSSASASVSSITGFTANKERKKPTFRVRQHTENRKQNDFSASQNDSLTKVP